MAQPPRVDVAIPCYKYGAMLPTAVRSVLDQEGVDVRVLIIDDASGDGSADVALGLARGDDRIQVSAHEHNKGHISTFNEGVPDWPQGDYVLLLSADDALTPGAMRRASRLMESNPAVSFVYGPAISWDGTLPLPAARNGVPDQVIHSGLDWISRERFPLRAPTACPHPPRSCGCRPRGRPAGTTPTCCTRATSRCGCDWHCTETSASSPQSTRPTAASTPRTCPWPTRTATAVWATSDAPAGLPIAAPQRCRHSVPL